MPFIANLFIIANLNSIGIIDLQKISSIDMSKYSVLFILFFFAFFPDLKSQNIARNEPLADKMNLSGIEMMSKGLYKEAICFFDSAIRYNNRNPEYFRNRGFSKESSGNDLEALSDYHSSIALQPANYDYQFLAGKIYLKIKSYDSAIYCFTRAIKLIPDKKNKDLVLLYFNRGNTLLKQQKFEQAIKDFNESISLDKTYYPSYANRGIALFSVKRHDAACNDWYVASSNGIKLAADYYDKYCLNYEVPEILVARVEEDKKRNGISNQSSPGDQVLKTTSADSPKISEDRMVYRIEVDLMPEFIGGMEAFHSYLQNKTKFPELAREYGVQGTVYTTFVVEADGSITHAKILKGIAKVLDEECLKVVNSMPKWKPGIKDSHPVAVQFVLPLKFSIIGVNVKTKDKNFENGMELLKNKDFENAKSSFSKSIDHNGYSSVEAYLYRGVCCYQLGDYKNAVADILFAKDLRAKDVDSVLVANFYPIASSYLEKKNYEDAVTTFSEMIAVKSGNKDAYYGRGMAYYSLGKNPEACEDFKRAKHLGLQEAADMIVKCCTK
jgi:TonB family protein